MKKTYTGKNTTMTLEVHKPTKWYQWVVIISLISGVVYFLAKLPV